MSRPVPRALLYARVSGGPGQDEARQIDDLEREAVRRGCAIAETVREIETGAKEARPGLERVRELVKARGVDVLLVSEVSRLSRAGIGSVFDIVRELDAAHVELGSLTEPFLSGPLRDPILALVAWFASEERRLISERTKSGQAHAKAIGKRIGRPPRINPELLSEIRRLREGERLRWSQIAVRLHVPGSSARKWYSNSKRAAPTLPSDMPRVIKRVQ